MKKKTAATVCMVSMLLLSGCGKKDQITNNYQEGVSQWTLVGSIPLVGGLYSQTLTAFLGVSGNDLFASFSCPTMVWNDGVYRSSDNGVSWTAVMPDSFFVSALAKNSNYFFGAYSFWDNYNHYYGISRSTNNGVTWSPTAFNNTDTLQIYSLALNSSFIFAGTSMGVYRSSSNGDAWTQTALPVSSGYAFMVQSLAINNSYIFAGTYVYDGCTSYNTPIIYRSSDNGDSWVAVDDSIYATALAVSGTDLFAISMNQQNASPNQKYGLCRSSDNGMTWKYVLKSFVLSAIAISGDTIITSTSPSGSGSAGNVLFSTDKGATWTQTEGVGVTLVENNGYLFSIDLGGNIWRRSLKGL